MVKGRVSVIIPARNERYLVPTVTDLLAKACGDLEILVMLEGLPWPNPPLPDDPRVRVLFAETPRGMRPSITEGVHAATGEYVLKCDAHMIFSEGFDVALAADCDDDHTIVVPMRHSIHQDTWTVAPRSYVHHFLTFPWRLSLYGMGLHAKSLDTPLNKRVNEARASAPVDPIMGCQGSCWFQARENYLRLGPLDHENLYFYSESVELFGRQIASGGRCVGTRNAWAAHLHKGKDNTGADGRPGRGYYLDVRRKWASEGYVTGLCLADRWPDSRVSFRQFVESFDWLLGQLRDEDRWPEDWDHPKYRQEFFAMADASTGQESQHLRVFADAARRAAGGAW